MWHGYFAVEDLNLSATQRETLIGQLKKLGPPNSPKPHYRNHWRVRLDGRAAIFEALFNENALTVDAFKQKLGALFGVDPDTIDHSVIMRDYAGNGSRTPIATFSRGGTDYLRFAAFAGVPSDRSESGDECRAYLAANAAEWESEL